MRWNVCGNPCSWWLRHPFCHVRCCRTRETPEMLVNVPCDLALGRVLVSKLRRVALSFFLSPGADECRGRSGRSWIKQLVRKEGCVRVLHQHAPRHAIELWRLPSFCRGLVLVCGVWLISGHLSGPAHAWLHSFQRMCLHGLRVLKCIVSFSPILSFLCTYLLIFPSVLMLRLSPFPIFLTFFSSSLSPTFVS